jgi:hypothetical protein
MTNITIDTNQATAIIPYAKNIIITHEPIKTLPSAGFDLVGAPGAGKRIAVLDAHAIIDTTAGGYTVDANCRWQLFLGTKEITGLAQPELALATTPGLYILRFPELAAVGVAGDGGYFVTTPKDVASMINQPLRLRDNYNGVADYTDGNPANTVTVVIYFAII